MEFSFLGTAVNLDYPVHLLNRQHPYSPHGDCEEKLRTKDAEGSQVALTSEANGKENKRIIKKGGGRHGGLLL